MPKLFVVAGHGAGDPGTCGNGFSEAERVRVLARKIKELGGGNVILGDLSRDYYRDNGVSTLNLPGEYEIVELHMDAGQETARGGHVIIYSGFEADDYDKALADMLADILPGRSQMIVERDNLANLERAAMRGYGYRLVEFGFITNAEDVK
ncbi:N-acetylmuramoyl-L-alanine amidase, partial [Lachnospiraceae bacterium]|nr:N-acetylmuramoyl-L-alanine amidase [Lachnospiraceae bacterium]